MSRDKTEVATHLLDRALEARLPNAPLLRGLGFGQKYGLQLSRSSARSSRK
jgi:hypothetical protein